MRNLVSIGMQYSGSKRRLRPFQPFIGLRERMKEAIDQFVNQFGTSQLPNWAILHLRRTTTGSGTWSVIEVLFFSFQKFLLKYFSCFAALQL